MDVEKFKSDLRKVIEVNPQQINFKITYDKPSLFEEFTTKKEFGNRILELLSSPDFKEINVTMVRIDGYIGRYCDGMEGLIITEYCGVKKKIPEIRTNVKEIHFHCETFTNDVLKLEVNNFEII